MSYEIFFTDSFNWKLKPLIKKYSSIKADLIQLRTELLANPTAGDALGRDCFKVRMRIGAKNTGKSGGARVITCVKVVDNQIFLLTNLRQIGAGIHFRQRTRRTITRECLIIENTRQNPLTGIFLTA